MSDEKIVKLASRTKYIKLLASQIATIQATLGALQTPQQMITAHPSLDLAAAARYRSSVKTEYETVIAKLTTEMETQNGALQDLLDVDPIVYAPIDTMVGTTFVAPLTTAKTRTTESQGSLNGNKTLVLNAIRQDLPIPILDAGGTGAVSTIDKVVIFEAAYAEAWAEYTKANTALQGIDAAIAQMEIGGFATNTAIPSVDILHDKLTNNNYVNIGADPWQTNLNNVGTNGSYKFLHNAATGTAANSAQRLALLNKLKAMKADLEPVVKARQVQLLRLETTKNIAKAELTDIEQRIKALKTDKADFIKSAAINTRNKKNADNSDGGAFEDSVIKGNSLQIIPRIAYYSIMAAFLACILVLPLSVPAALIVLSCISAVGGLLGIIAAIRHAINKGADGWTLATILAGITFMVVPSSMVMSAALGGKGALAGSLMFASVGGPVAIATICVAFTIAMIIGFMLKKRFLDESPSPINNQAVKYLGYSLVAALLVGFFVGLFVTTAPVAAAFLAGLTTLVVGMFAGGYNLMSKVSRVEKPGLKKSLAFAAGTGTTAYAFLLFAPKALAISALSTGGAIFVFAIVPIVLAFIGWAVWTARKDEKDLVTNPPTPAEAIEMQQLNNNPYKNPLLSLSSGKHNTVESKTEAEATQKATDIVVKDLSKQGLHTWQTSASFNANPAPITVSDTDIQGVIQGSLAGREAEAMVAQKAF